MSLAIDGFWKAGFWAETFWADGFWYEGVPRETVVENTDAGVGSSSRNRKPRRRYVKVENKKLWFESEAELLEILDKAKNDAVKVARKTAKRIGAVTEFKQIAPPVVQFKESKLQDFSGITRRIEDINAQIAKTFNDVMVNEMIRREEQEELEVIEMMLEERKSISQLLKDLYAR
jgi:hypothetical protein